MYRDKKRGTKLTYIVSDIDATYVNSLTDVELLIDT